MFVLIIIVLSEAADEMLRRCTLRNDGEKRVLAITDGGRFLIMVGRDILINDNGK